MALDPYRFVHPNASRVIWDLARKIWTDCHHYGERIAAALGGRTSWT